MKIYRGIKKRLAKKILGKYWYKILWGSTLKPGDLVATCRGYNERIEEIEPEFNRRVVYDFNLVMEGGGCCSLAHCCNKPQTKEQLLQDFQWFNTANGQEWLDKQRSLGYEFANEGSPIKRFIDGEEVFDKNGMLI